MLSDAAALPGLSNSQPPAPTTAAVTAPPATSVRRLTPGSAEADPGWVCGLPATIACAASSTA